VYKNITIQEEILFLNQYLPSGEIWNAKNQDKSNLRAIVVSFANVVNTYRQDVLTLKKETNIYLTSLFIDKWEHYVGLPDEILIARPDTLTLEKRIQNVIFKLIGLKAYSRTEIAKTILDLFDVEMESFYKARLTFPYTFSIFLSDSSSDGFQIKIILKSNTERKDVESVIKSLLDFDKMGFVEFLYSPVS